MRIQYLLVRLVTPLLACGKFAIDAAFYRPACVKSLRTPLSILSDRSPSTTILYSSSLKFKNFDMMLDAFREEPVLIYFTSMTCGPCKLQKKELSTVHMLLGANALKVLSIDTEKFPYVGSRYKIGKLPSLLLIKDREVMFRLEGLTKADVLVEHFHSKVGPRP
jgi:thiol-disulfide isomerase/thioredoxin